MGKRPKIEIADPYSVIGKEVVKYSGKPFKSGNKKNTVKSVTSEPPTLTPTGKNFNPGLSFTFEEDESIVSVRTCELAEEVEKLQICNKL